VQVTLDAVLNIILAVVVPGAMALMGGILAARALQAEPGKKNPEMWYWISGFVFLFVLSIILVFVQQIRLTNKETAAEERAHQSELHSNGEIKYMQGQLETTNRVLGTLATNSDPKQTALLFKALLSATSTPKKDAVSFGNLALRCDKLSKDIHQFVVNQNNQEPVPKRPENHKAWVKANDEEFRKSYYPEVKKTRDVLQGLNFEDPELNRILNEIENTGGVYISIGWIQQIGEGFGRLAEQVRNAK
jgi:hypothetical protein